MIPAILLAGGASSRMGRPKALLPVGPLGESFLERITRALMEGGADEVIAVLGAGADLVRDAIRPTARLRFVDNPDHSSGQLSSLLTGLRLADRPGVQAVLVTLVDVPLVSPETVRAVLNAYRAGAGGATIVRPSRKGQHGHPVIFDRALFEVLRRADLADGAKAVVRAHGADLLDVEVSDAGAFIDIDTPDDYARHVGPFPKP